MEIKEAKNELLQEEITYYGESRQESEFLGNLSSASAPSTAGNITETGMVDKSVWNPFLSTPQSNRMNGSSRKANPFYVHYKESLSTPVVKQNGGSKDADVAPDLGIGFDQAPILAPPPEFQSVWSEPDIRDQKQGLSENELRDQRLDLSQNVAWTETPGLDKPVGTPNQPRDLFESPTSKAWDFKTPASQKNNIFAAPIAKAKEFVQATPSNEVDIFRRSSTNQEDVFSRPTAIFSADPFEPMPSADIFQTLPSDPSPTQLGRPLISNSFPSKPQGLFQSATPSNTDDLFDSPSHLDLKVTRPAAQSEGELDVFSDSPLDNAVPSISLPVKTLPRRQVDAVLLPRRTKPSVLLQPTPFSQAKSLFGAQTPTPSPSPPPLEQPSPDISQTTTFSRHPNPAPRLKRDRRPSQVAAKPEPTAPIPAPRSRLPFQEKKDAEDNAVFQNILLIGQERCVEDWPQDSPQLEDNWKPSGTLKLRRESLRVTADSDGGSGEDTLGKNKRGNKLKAFLSRRGSKGIGDDLKQGTPRRRSKISHDIKNDDYSPRRSSKENFWDDDFPPKIKSPLSEEEREEEPLEKDSGTSKKKFKTKMLDIQRRSSKNKYEVQESGSDQQSNLRRSQSPFQDKRSYGNLAQASREDAFERKYGMDFTSTCRIPENTVAAKNSEEDEDLNRAPGQRPKTGRKVSVKFVPKRGYSISLKERDDKKLERTSQRGSKDFAFEDTEGAKGYTPHTSSKNAFQDEDYLKKGADLFYPEMMDKEQITMQEIKLNQSTKQRWSVVKSPINSKSSEEDATPTGTSSNFPPSQMSKNDMMYHNNNLELSNWASDYEDFGHQEKETVKPKRHTKSKAPLVSQRAADSTPDVILHESVQIGSSCYSPKTAYKDVLEDGSFWKGDGVLFAGKANEEGEDEDELEKIKPKKAAKSKAYKHRRDRKDKAMPEHVPGATSGDFYLSEAAEAEWLAAQKDERVTAGLEEGDADGDTDSLMEWWNTVEQWDEVESDEEPKKLEVDETKSFTALAEKVQRGLQVYNKVFTENAEVLWQYVYLLHAIADNITEFHKKTKIANVTGGTTTAVGGVAAIAGLALAPFTFGASLIVTAVGVGVATAGGIASASATISDNVNNMHDRKKIEVVLEDYITRLEDVGRILRFVLQAILRLRAHPLLRAGTQHYSEDWDIRRAVQIISLVDRPCLRAVEVTDISLSAATGLFQGLEKYFAKDTSELTKGFKKVIVRQIRHVAEVLHEGLVELNGIREELQESNGQG